MPVLSPDWPQQPDEAAFLEGDQSENEIDSDNRLTPDWSQAGEVNVPGIGQRRCRVCRRNTVKQLVSTVDVAQNYDRHLWDCMKEIRCLSSNKSDDSKHERQRQRQRPFNLSVVGDADISSNRTEIDVAKMCGSEKRVNLRNLTVYHEKLPEPSSRLKDACQHCIWEQITCSCWRSLPLHGIRVVFQQQSQPCKPSTVQFQALARA